MELELIKTFIEYHIDMSRRVWDSINQITDEQFLADDAYSRGSIRNLMVHLVNHGTDHRSTVLQKLTELGAPTFDQDFIIWLWSKSS